MKMKLSLAAALAHRPRLLILDEATAGLDPVVRDSILEELLSFVSDEEHAVLLSSHITGDLEKIADYITYLHRGQVILSGPKDEILERYGQVGCSAAQLAALEPELLTRVRRGEFGCHALVADRAAFSAGPPGASCGAGDPGTISCCLWKGGGRMTGLILKDALVLKKSLRELSASAGRVRGADRHRPILDKLLWPPFLEVIAMMLPMSAFAFDEQAHWDRYAAALPLSRRTWWPPGICSPCWCCCALRPLGRPLCAVLSFSGDWDAVTECGMSIAATLLVGVLALSVSMPLNYRLGPERARIALYVTLLLPVAALFVSIKGELWSGSQVTRLEELPPLLLLLPYLLLVGVALAVSFAVSCGIMAEKRLLRGWHHDPSLSRRRQRARPPAAMGLAPAHGGAWQAPWSWPSF